MAYQHSMFSIVGYFFVPWSIRAALWLSENAPAFIFDPKLYVDRKVFFDAK